MAETGQITTLLSFARAGDRAALDAAFAIVYDEVKRIARRQIAKVGRADTLNTTAVVHETYVKLSSHFPLQIDDRNHLLSLAARAMRQILVDHARAHLTRKRGGGAELLSLGEVDVPVEERATEIVELDAALERLAALDERLSRVIELRFFGGLSVGEAAAVLGVNDRTVKRDWRKARALLFEDLSEGRAV